ncbi:MAG: SEC-C metal-binding domain-containing protein [Myxococcota bacterium]|jgi:hypothetical protein|nr:SEC-C metal-binding domain-containing protein [Myxococcota bacterium]
MSHAHHFLSRLERVEPREQELALQLYRTPNLVRELIAFMQEELELRSERYAIELFPDPLAPTLIVTEHGRFVTCLGEGMESAGWPRIPFHLVRDRAARTANGETAHRSGLLERLVRHPSELSQDEFQEASLISPFLHQDMLLLAVELAKDVANRLPHISRLSRAARKQRQGSAAKELARDWTSRWAIGVLHLCTAQAQLWRTRRGEPLVPSAIPSISGLLVSTNMGLWLESRIGHHFLEHILDEFRDFGHTSVGASLATLAIRHRGLRSSIVRQVQRLMGESSAFGSSRAGSLVLCRHLLEVIEHPIPALRRTLARGHRLLDLHRPAFAKLSPLPHEERLVRTFALRDPRELTRETWSELVDNAALLAEVDAEEFFLPKNLQPLCAIPFDLRWYEEHVRLYSSTVKKPEQSARNAPCPCGSGKKTKHCTACQSARKR